jgi:hypothetical protein
MEKLFRYGHSFAGVSFAGVSFAAISFAIQDLIGEGHQ